MTKTCRRCGWMLAGFIGWLHASGAAPAGGSPDQAPTASARAALHQVMVDNRSWPMIHAAEALIAHGESKEVRDYFLSKFVGHETPPLRTGVWRVLAAASPSTGGRAKWIAKIADVLGDSRAPDRDLALETLCKTGYRPGGAGLESVRRMTEEAVAPEKVIPWWGLQLGGDPAVLPLIVGGLGSSDLVVRRRSAYVLRWLRVTDAAILQKLVRAATTEPPGSDTHVFMCSAVVSLGASKGDEVAWRNKLAALLPKASSSARFEICQTLAHFPSREELPEMEQLLGDPDPDTRVGAANVILATLKSEGQSRVISLRDLPLLFVDDTGVAHRRNLVRRQHPGKLWPEPILLADKPWEGERVYLFGTVRFDPVRARYEMWYVGVPARGEVLSETKRVFVPGFREGGATLLLYATSHDGAHWDKPQLGLYEFGGSTANNIVFDFDSATVEVDAREPDPARRYKVVGYSGGGYRSAVSPDGLHWTDTSALPILSGADTVTMARDPETGDFLAFHKRPQLVRGFDRRVVWLSRSKDFKTWSEPKLVLSPDEADDLWCTRPQERTEFYNMSVFPHAGGFIGLPTVFRVEYELPQSSTGSGQSRWNGPIDVEIASSVDGEHWLRSWPRLNMVPHGAPGEFNGGAILGLASAPVNAGKETWVYYTVLTTNHGGTMPPKRIAVARADWRRDGFVSLDVGPEGGELQTVPLRFRVARLVINADVQRGSLRAGIVELDGRAIEGLALADCEPLQIDATSGEMRWKGGHRPPIDRAVRVLLEMNNTRLFSLGCGEGEPATER